MSLAVNVKHMNTNVVDALTMVCVCAGVFATIALIVAIVLQQLNSDDEVSSDGDGGGESK